MKKVAIVFVALLTAFSLAACSNSSNESATSASSSSMGLTVNDAAFTIETPYCNLLVPQAFMDNVEWEVESTNPYTLSFKTKDGKDIFTLYFGKETSNIVGTLRLSDKNVPIYVEFASLDQNADDYNEMVKYQEGINDIIEGLTSSTDFVVNEAVEYEEQVESGTFGIETNLVTLQYPAKWKNMVDIEVGDKQVAFSYNDASIFTLYFEEVADGYLLGTYKDTPIYVVTYEMDEDKIQVGNWQTFSAMQNDVNVIIQNLMNDENFVIREER